MAQVDLIKAQASKLEMILAKFSELQPRFQEILGKDQEQANAQFSAWLGEEFGKIGLVMDAGSLSLLTNGLSIGGVGGMAIAIFADITNGLGAFPFPATPRSDAIERPDCPECGAMTELFGIEPERPGHELRTCVCHQCEHIETTVGPVA